VTSSTSRTSQTTALSGARNVIQPRSKCLNQLKLTTGLISIAILGPKQSVSYLSMSVSFPMFVLSSPRSALIETVAADCADLASQLSQDEAAGTSAAADVNATGRFEARRTIIDALEPYLALSADDAPLIELLIKTDGGKIETEKHDAQLLKGLAKSSFVRDLPVIAKASEEVQVERELAILGTLVWFTLDINVAAARRLPVLLMEAYNSNLIGEKAFTTWETLSYEEFKRFLPSFYKSVVLFPYSSGSPAAAASKQSFAESFAQEKYLNKSSEKDLLLTETHYGQHKKILAKFLEWMNQSDEEDDEDDEEGDDEED
jgi:hypothetical protein